MKIRNARVSDNMQTDLPPRPANMPQEYYDLMAQQAGMDKTYSDSYEDSLIRKLFDQDDMLKLKRFSRDTLQRFSGPQAAPMDQLMEQLLAEPSSWKTSVKRLK